MPYYLGIDVGTTYTAAAVWRDGRVEVASLGLRAPVVPSLVFAPDDGGALLMGEAAQRRGMVEPQGLAREFKRRLGDPTPIVIGGGTHTAEALMARMVRWVVDTVTSQEGGPPAAISVSHPANWGTYKLDLLGGAVEAADVDDVSMVTEPEAAAIHYASQERIGTGSVVAVYDLGGGTFDVALLRKVDKGWEILGEPEGIERLGGIDFDEAVFRHVVTSTDSALEDLDPDDPKVLGAVARLRRECVDAKEALSSDSAVSIPVLLPPDVQADVRLTRAEFEQMIRLPLRDSIEALRRALRSAKVDVADIDQVLLVGGSSRIPLVAQLVASELGRPVAVDAHPKYAVSLGAAILAAEGSSADPVLTSQIVIPVVEAPVPAPAPVPLPDDDVTEDSPLARPSPPHGTPAPVLPPPPPVEEPMLAPSASVFADATEVAQPVAPAAPARGETRRVHVPAPMVAPTPATPARVRSSSGGYPAMAAPRRRRRGFFGRLAWWCAVLVVVASVGVAGVLVLEATNPDALDIDFEQIYSGS
ncbi:MAG TPA: Hsp70 family protein [Acidimicrobiales bacterium]|nr:Hsp70 family protein [Acidimicrobiales bacterium]